MLLQALAPADAIVLMRDRTRCRRRQLPSCPNLKLVVFTGTRNGARYQKRSPRAAFRSRIPAGGRTRMPPPNWTWALILAAQKRLLTHEAGLRRGDWRPLPTMLPVPCTGNALVVAGLEIGGRSERRPCVWHGGGDGRQT